MIQGGADMCNPPAESDRQGRFFTGAYRRVVLDEVGHFPAREAPDEVASAVLSHIREFV
jgi:pimeloyl-ACP methyl ester carboxylesterase